ncbi:unnamed protein product [Phytophthora lilii]|uniref:Unnamed protein product n=1 Tax=Phytophthora lilii TaxID=2077276 RepID=A0A9W6UAH5_9STRA|nr:unnamed protein product [Phytophthora lilii]
MSSSRNSSRRSSRNSDELSLASTCDERPRLNLPLDKEFLPLDSPVQDEHEKEQEQERVRDQVICMIFDLPESTQFYEGTRRSEGCQAAARRSRTARRKLDTILIPYESIREIEKTTTMVFQHSIRLATFDKDEYTFTSFWGNNRDSCYDLIVKTRDRVLRELRPTAVNSSESRYPTLPTSPISASPVASPIASLPTSQPNPTTEQEDEEEAERTVISSPDETAIAADDDTNTTVAEEDSNDQTAPVTPRRRSVVSDVDSIAPKDISMTQILEEVFPVSVDTFMQMFYQDGAPFGLDKFSEQTGSTEMTINPWMTPLEDDKSFGTCVSLGLG